MSLPTATQTRYSEFFFFFFVEVPRLVGVLGAGGRTPSRSSDKSGFLTHHVTRELNFTF